MKIRYKKKIKPPVLKRSKTPVLEKVEPPKPKSPVPEKEKLSVLGVVDRHIMAFGMSRSGSHCIYEWIINNFINNDIGPVWLINNCHRSCDVRRNNSLYNLKCQIHKKEKGEIKKIYLEKGDNNHKKSLSHKPVLFTAFEDSPHITYFRDHSYFNYNISKNDIINQHTVHILRDPFNLLASRIAYKHSLKFVSNTIPLWIEHAKQVLGQVNYLKSPVITVLYNNWKKDIEYRKSIISKLGIDTYYDDKIDYVPGDGNASSFDHQNLQGRGSQMKTLDRWKVFKDDDLYINRILRNDVINLSKKIFPKITQEICDYYKKD